MARADVAAKPAPVIDARAADAAISRVYNFAADILARNLEAGRADKPVYIDPRGSLTYGQLAERVDRFGHLLRCSESAARSASCWRCSTPSTGPPPSSARSRPGSSRSRSTP